MPQRSSKTLIRIPAHKLIAGLIALLLMLSVITIIQTVEADEFPADECTDSDEAWLFCDDFEEDRSAHYRIPYQSSPGKLYLQENKGLGESSTALTSEFSGTPSVGKLSLAFGKTPNPSTYKPVGDPDEAYKEIFWRTYVKNDENWTSGEGGTFATFYAYGTNNLILAKVELRYSYGRLYADLHPALLDGNGNPTGFASSPISILPTTQPAMKILGQDAQYVGKWNRVEVRIKQNDPGQSNGAFQLWVNNSTEISKTDLNWLGSSQEYGFNVVDLSNQLGGSNIPLQYRYHDNMVLSTERIGTASETLEPTPTPSPSPTPTATPTVNQHLQNLTLDSGTLIPAFAADKTSYTVELPATVASLGITADVAPGGAITINGQSSASGQAVYVPVSLNHNKVTVIATAQDGVTARTYTIDIKRPSVVNECSNPLQGWLFCDTFETNKLSTYYDYFSRWGRFDIGGKGIESSKGMVSYYGFYPADRLGNTLYPPHGTWLKLAVGKTPNNTVYKPVGDVSTAEREIHLRFLTRSNTLVQGTDSINRGPLARVYGYGPDNVPIMQIEVGHPDATGALVSKLSTGQFNTNGDPTGVQETAELVGTNPVMRPDQAGSWRVIEIHAKLNDPGQSNGVYELWIDGVLETSKTDLNWTGTYTDYGINVVELYNTNNAVDGPLGDDNEYRVFDNLVVSREPIGAPGAVTGVNASLKMLSKSAGKLSPYFQSNVLNYTLTVDQNVASAEITPVLDDAEATMKVNGVTHASLTPITITGANPLSIEVTSKNGTIKKTYKVNLKEAAPFIVNECSNMQSDWLFCDDYEINRMNQYFEWTKQSQFYRTTEVGLDGSSGMKAEFRQSDGAQHDTGAIKVAFGRTPSSYFKSVAAQNEDLREVYFRFYIKHEEGWTGGGGDKLARLSSMQTSNWAQAISAHVWSGYSANKNFLLAEPARGTDVAGNLKSTGWNDQQNMTWLGSQSSQTPIFDEQYVGSWYAVETRVKLNDPGQSNGIFQIWIDDELQMSFTDLNWIGSYQIGPGKGYGLNWLALENYWNIGSPQDQERYFDNFVVSRSKIGLASEATEEIIPSGSLAVDESATQVGESVELTISSAHVAPFTVADVIVHYDPQKLEFATETSGSIVSLAGSALESLLPNFNIISAVKESQGKIRVILTTAGESNAASGSIPLFKLSGKVKNDAAAGSTTVSLSDFKLAMNGTGETLNATDALVNITIANTDKADLIARIAVAQSTMGSAVIGSQPGQYPAASKTALEAAIQAATMVRNNAAATQTEVNHAVSALNSAILAFTNSVISSVPTDFSALQAAISLAESKFNAAIEGSKLGQYAPGSKTVLSNAINAAKSVRGNSSATQAQVNQAVLSLNAARETFAATFISLTSGATQISIYDLSIMARYFGTTDADNEWSEIAIADVLDQGEITIEALAAVAQMILADWLQNE
ncbi:cadherin-like beta sandwich domain-containing protein [Paenibacillus sp. PAMC21692]|uniref:cadherin-like beta sandwich domain-containing protein n=1 Tax=Paenibacillus sp. PAMC21692 TaxID=2762320 RepID=UPI00164CE4C6|nr:cadherin-like beta sandwich domain-containing protein [Paenibacillus sp. PAMC21692]QNK60130.1 cadherin-like beta sandwich domain-containing protein [Paenibacillus sp. PAMC21692]